MSSAMGYAIQGQGQYTRWAGDGVDGQCGAGRGGARVVNEAGTPDTGLHHLLGGHPGGAGLKEN